MAHEKCIKTTTTQMLKLQEPVRKYVLENVLPEIEDFPETIE